MQTPLRALYIVYKPANADPRVIREMNALVDQGYSIDIVCVTPPGIPPENPHPSIHVHALTIARKRQGALRYLYEYLSFFFFASFKVTQLLLRHRVRFVQVFTMPEPLVFTCLTAKLLGIRIIMDWEDPTYELFLTKFKSSSAWLSRKVILGLEYLSVHFVDHIITPNSAFKDAFVGRGFAAEKIDIVLNAPDTRVFKYEIARDSQEHAPLTVLFNGSIFYRHGVDIGIEGFSLLKKLVPDARMIIVGEGESAYTTQCLAIIHELGIKSSIDWREGVTIDKMPQVYQEASMVIIPNRRNPFTSINFPQRIFECGVMRRPAVVSRLPGIQAYMSEDSVQFVEPDDPQALCDGMLQLYRDHAKYQSIVKRAGEICRSISWESEYLNSIGRQRRTGSRPDSISAHTFTSFNQGN